MGLICVYFFSLNLQNPYAIFVFFVVCVFPSGFDCVWWFFPFPLLNHESAFFVGLVLFLFEWMVFFFLLALNRIYFYLEVGPFFICWWFSLLQWLAFFNFKSLANCNHSVLVPQIPYQQMLRNPVIMMQLLWYGFQHLEITQYGSLVSCLFLKWNWVCSKCYPKRCECDYDCVE